MVGGPGFEPGTTQHDTTATSGQYHSADFKMMLTGLDHPPEVVGVKAARTKSGRNLSRGVTDTEAENKRGTYIIWCLHVGPRAEERRRGRGTTDLDAGTERFWGKWEN